MNMTLFRMSKNEKLGPVARSHACLTYSGGCGFDPLVRQRSFMEIGHEIISVAILPTADSRKAFVSYWWKDCSKYWLTA